MSPRRSFAGPTAGEPALAMSEPKGRAPEQYGRPKEESTSAREVAGDGSDFFSCGLGGWLVGLVGLAAVSLLGIYAMMIVLGDWEIQALSGSRQATVDRVERDELYELVGAHNAFTSLRHNTVRESSVGFLPSEMLASVCPPDVPNWNGYIFHGAAMSVAWGLIIPISVVVAGTLKDLDPLWFELHRGLSLAGLGIATVAWIYALVAFAPLNFLAPGMRIAPVGASHALTGMSVMVLGLLQPVGALFRPPKDDKHRWIFNWVHGTSGRIAWFGGLVNPLLGMLRLQQLDSSRVCFWPGWLLIYLAWVLVYMAIWAALEVRKAHLLSNIPQAEPLGKLEDSKTSL